MHTLTDLGLTPLVHASPYGHNVHETRQTTNRSSFIPHLTKPVFFGAKFQWVVLVIGLSHELGHYSQGLCARLQVGHKFCKLLLPWDKFGVVALLGPL